MSAGRPGVGRATRVTRRFGRATLTLGVLAATAAMPLLSARAQPASAGGVVIRVLSNRADLMSGGDALVEVTLPAGVTPGSAEVHLNGRNVTTDFSAGRLAALLRGIPRQNLLGLDPRANALVGEVSGMTVGRNVLKASLPNGAGAQITLTNHPLGGPLFSGPQIQPWPCTTTANNLGAPRDRQCNAKTTYQLYYHSTDPTVCQSANPCFKPYDPKNPPATVPTTKTDSGATVPYIVRLETGTMDRGINTLAVLYDPSKQWVPWSPQTGWNHKLFVEFGASCAPHYGQTPPEDSVLADQPLSKGFMVIASGIMGLGNQCNPFPAAETLVMFKEHVIDTYGLVRFTMSQGCSGASMLQNWTASNYPGLLDGIQPSCSYPDIWETYQEAEDCHVLDHVFDELGAQEWNPAQEAIVDGYQGNPTTCRGFWDGPSGNSNVPASAIAYARNWADPTTAASCGLPAAQVYSRTTHKGVRCTLQDYWVNELGRRKSDGFANFPYDNVGVQYGLQAVNSNQITPQQFADLNSQVGGFDVDYQFTTKRAVADHDAVVNLYKTGGVNAMNESNVAILDLRSAEDQDIHLDFHGYVQRARLVQTTGSYANQVIWSGVPGFVAPPAAVTAAGFVAMDKWMTNIEADQRNITRSQKIAQDKPANVVDSCWINGTQVTDQSTCRAALPYSSDPHLAAGAPPQDNIVKCQLKPLNPADYTVTFTAAQWAELKQAFPTGVCNFNLRGVGQQPPTRWAAFTHGPGGQPLGAGPVSSPSGGSPSTGGTGGSGAIAESLPTTGGDFALPTAAIALCLAAAIAYRRSVASASWV